jgi:acyl carrier protein
MTEMSVTEKRVRQVLNDALELNVPEEELVQAERLDDLFGVDSLAIIEFVTALEKEFQLRLDAEEITRDLIRDLPRLSKYIDALQLQGQTSGREREKEADDR